MAEREVITYKSELRPIVKGDGFYTELLTDNMECTFSTRLHPLRCTMFAFWTFHLDEHIKPRAIIIKANVNLYRTDFNGKRTLAVSSSLHFPTPSPVRIAFKDRHEHENTKLDFELEMVIQKRPLKIVSVDGKYEEKSNKNNRALLIDGTIVYVNEKLLANNSNYFRCLFSQDYCDSKKDVIPVGLCTYEEFVMLLSTFHGPHVEEIRDTQIEQLLELAERFQLSIVTEKIEHHLIHTSEISRAKVLWLAEQYFLPSLIDGVLANIQKHDLRMINYRRFYTVLSDETKKKLEELQLATFSKSKEYIFI